VLPSERQRVLRLASLLGILLSLILLLRETAPQLVTAVFHGRIPLRTPLAIFLPFIAYELIVAGVVTYLIRRDGEILTFARYANAFIETSMPTVFILSLTRALEAPIAVASWPSLLYFLFIVFSTLRLDFALSVFTGAVAAVELFALAWYTLPLAWIADNPGVTIFYHAARSLVLLMAGAIASSVGMQLKRRFARAIQITDILGQHVSPPVAERLLAIDAGDISETRAVTVMFADIRGFTAAAHGRGSAEVVARLNEAFAILVAVVDRHHGIVNRFLGDGFLAMWGAPLDDPAATTHAVAAGREMLRAIAAGNVGNPWPIRIGIGINVGEAVTGNVGSPRRKEYTVIGDSVNLAARLESLNKELGSQLLVSSAVRAAAPSETADAVPVGPVAIRGYDEPITVWRLA
jgi:adenylate cyclase